MARAILTLSALLEYHKHAATIAVSICSRNDIFIYPKDKVYVLGEILKKPTLLGYHNEAFLLILKMISTSNGDFLDVKDVLQLLSNESVDCNIRIVLAEAILNNSKLSWHHNTTAAIAEHFLPRNNIDCENKERII